MGLAAKTEADQASADIDMFRDGSKNNTRGYQMDVTRRDFLKTGGTAAMALGLSQLKVPKAEAARDVDVDVFAFHCGILKTKT